MIASIKIVKIIFLFCLWKFNHRSLKFIIFDFPRLLFCNFKNIRIHQI